jgi:regulator of protease activity HflC (stomatin/prohibitin superfamily)
MNPAIMVALGVLALFAFILVSMSIRIIRPFERGMIERLGKYQRILDPGLNMIVPFFDTVIKVDMREVVLDVPPQLVITRDNVNVEVDAIIYAQVTDPVRSRYEIANYIIAATKLAQTNLRNVIGELDLDACLSSRDTVNAQLRDVLDEATDKWGVRVNRLPSSMPRRSNRRTSPRPRATNRHRSLRPKVRPRRLRKGPMPRCIVRRPSPKVKPRPS